MVTCSLPLHYKLYGTKVIIIIILTYLTIESLVLSTALSDTQCIFTKELIKFEKYCFEFFFFVV